MPKRSNDFQRLVYLLQQATKPLNATVTESELEPDTSTGEPREIDVCMKYPDGDVRILIAVEAKYEKRKMSLDRFDALLGKYFVAGGVAIDKLVVVNAAGFVRRTVERARTVNKSGKHAPVELMTMSNALTPSAWGQCFPASTVMKMKLPLELHVEFTKPRILGLSMKDLVDEGALVAIASQKATMRLNEFALKYLYPEVHRQKRNEIEFLKRRAASHDHTAKTRFECACDNLQLTHGGRIYIVQGFGGKLVQPKENHPMVFTRKDILDVLTGKQRRFAVASIVSDSLALRMTFPDGPDSEHARLEVGRLPLKQVTFCNVKMR